MDTRTYKGVIVMEYVTRSVPVFTLPGTGVSLSVYRGVIVHWDEDHDSRVLNLIDDMTEKDRHNLVAIHEREGQASYVWNGKTPAQYEEGVNTRCGDHWPCSETIELLDTETQNPYRISGAFEAVK